MSEYLSLLEVQRFAKELECRMNAQEKAFDRKIQEIRKEFQIQILNTDAFLNEMEQRVADIHHQQIILQRDFARVSNKEIMPSNQTLFTFPAWQGKNYGKVMPGFPVNLAMIYSMSGLELNAVFEFYGIPLPGGSSNERRAHVRSFLTSFDV